MKKLKWEIKKDLECNYFLCDKKARYLLIDRYVPHKRWYINIYCSVKCIKNYLEFRETPPNNLKDEKLKKELTQYTRFLKNRFLIIELKEFKPWQFEENKKGGENV